MVKSPSATAAKSNTTSSKGSWIIPTAFTYALLSTPSTPQQALCISTHTTRYPNTPTSGREPLTGPLFFCANFRCGSESEERSETPSGAAAPSYGLTLRRQSRQFAKASITFSELLSHVARAAYTRFARSGISSPRGLTYNRNMSAGLNEKINERNA